MRASDPIAANATARFVIHVMTLNPGQSCKADEHYKMISLNPLEESTIPFRVTVCELLDFNSTRSN